MHDHNNDIQQGLEQEARQIVERVPKTADKEELRRIADTLQIFISENDYTQTAVARWIGVSTATVNTFLSNKYRGDNVNLANKIVNFINSVKRKQKREKNYKFIYTTVAHRIHTLLKQTESFCDSEGKIGVIIGDSGHGKTECLRQYSQANKNTAYIELDDSMTAVPIFAKIAEAVQLDPSGTLSAISARLVTGLKNRHLLIMLDEASALSIKTLNQLRQIIVVKSSCPLILSGNSFLLETINQPSSKRGYESLDQLRSRMIGTLNLDELAGDKDGGLYSIEDVRQLYEYGGIRLTSDAVDTLRRICSVPQTGRLRTCNHLIAALHTAKSIQQAMCITGENIVSAISQLDLPVKAWLPLIASKRLAEDQRAVSAAG
jgi:DNA transposition AAA+ family ATPase